MARAGLEHAPAELTDERLCWLLERPQRTTVGDDSYQLVHSHPDPEELGFYVRPRQFPNMRPYLNKFEGIILGHTHIQHKAVIDDRLIVNPGSVGQPRDKDSKAAYAVLDVDAEKGGLPTCRVRY